MLFYTKYKLHNIIMVVLNETIFVSEIKFLLLYITANIFYIIVVKFMRVQF